MAASGSKTTRIDAASASPSAGPRPRRRRRQRADRDLGRRGWTPWGVALLAIGIGCTGGAPRLLQLPPPRPHAGPCGHAAFELPLRPDGGVERERMRLLLWEPASTDPDAFVGLHAVAARSRWQLPEPAAAGVVTILQLDCSGRAGPDTSRAWAAFAARVERAGAARRRAAAALRRATGQSWSEHDLDCLWSALAPLQRGPFVHDALEFAPAVERAVRAADTADGGVWVCRAARSPHQGQFVFLDRHLVVLGTARYWLGE